MFLKKEGAFHRLQAELQSSGSLSQAVHAGEAKILINALKPLPLLPPAWTDCAVATCNCRDFAPDKWCKHYCRETHGYSLYPHTDTGYKQVQVYVS